MTAAAGQARSCSLLLLAQLLRVSFPAREACAQALWKAEPPALRTAAWRQQSLGALSLGPWIEVLL